MSKDLKNNSQKSSHDVSFETRMIHGESLTQAWDFSKPLIPPVSSSTTFRLGSVERGAAGFQSFASEKFNDDPIWIYDRLDDPNALMLENQLAKAEGAETAVTFGTGMAAIAGSILTLCKQNQEVLCHKTIYGCTFSLLKNWLPKFGIQGKFVDLTQGCEEFITDKTRIIYFETVSNPDLEIIDIESIAAITRKLNINRSDEDKILIVIDNTFPTPCGAQPLRLGADLVIHSLTKNISGFGTEMGGVVIGAKRFETSLKLARKDFGAVLHPHAAWDINVHGLPTLYLRNKQQQQNALQIAQFLEAHPAVKSVKYPGLESFKFFNMAQKVLRNAEGEFNPGYMISFELHDAEKHTTAFVNHVAEHSYSITLAVSLGLTKTLIELPNYMTHAAVDEQHKTDFKFDPFLVRLSVGLENANDIINDLKAALP
ncbi:MAG: PLP-dependent transferase [Bdellovibrionaceae bacterium]|nr:PLP-dependent transferase [Pseudobdellovibrionaceae bacterium]